MTKAMESVALPPDQPKKDKRQVAKNPKPTAETASDKFRRLIDKRMESALGKIALVANLAKPSYEFSKGEADAVISHLSDAVAEVKTAYEGRLKGKRRFSIKKG